MIAHRLSSQGARTTVTVVSRRSRPSSSVILTLPTCGLLACTRICWPSVDPCPNVMLAGSTVMKSSLALTLVMWSLTGGTCACQIRDRVLVGMELPLPTTGRREPFAHASLPISLTDRQAPMPRCWPEGSLGHWSQETVHSAGMRTQSQAHQAWRARAAWVVAQVGRRRGIPADGPR